MIVQSIRSRYAERSAHFSPDELYDAPPFAPADRLVYGPLLDLAEAVRTAWGKPLTVTAGVRTEAKQRDLKRRGYLTASYSPHVWHFAIDLDTANQAETERLVETVRKASKATGIPCRIGHRQYSRAGQSFVHIDVGPHIVAALGGATKAATALGVPVSIARTWGTAGLEW